MAQRPVSLLMVIATVMLSLATPQSAAGASPDSLCPLLPLLPLCRR